MADRRIRQNLQLFVNALAVICSQMGKLLRFVSSI